MTSFTDNTGQTWVITIDDVDRLRIQKEASVHLGGAIDAIAQAMLDTRRRHAVLWAAMRPQMEAEGIEFQEFVRRVLVGGETQQKASRALLAALCRDEEERYLVEITLGR